jgi:predicted RNA-binding protein with RPS1 domain
LTVGKTTRRDNNRGCIGCKPVTDFAMGDFYPGRVRYIKPKLGAFVNVSSHSDAFCHISCTLDAFVSSVAEILKVDNVVNVRVVEVDLG